MNGAPAQPSSRFADRLPPAPSYVEFEGEACGDGPKVLKGERRRAGVALVNSAADYPVAMHLAAWRIADVLAEVIRRAHPDLAAIWAAYPEDLGQGRPSTARAKCIAVLGNLLPLDWDIHLCEDGIDAEVPRQLWLEFAGASKVTRLQVSFSCNKVTSGGQLLRRGPSHYAISLGLGPFSLWAMLCNDFRPFLDCVVSHELAHIVHYGDEENEAFTVESPLYPFMRRELVPYAVSAAVLWADAFPSEDFSLDCAEKCNRWIRRPLAILRDMPRDLNFDLRGRPLAYWQRCFLRLVRRHLRFYRAARTALGQ